MFWRKPQEILPVSYRSGGRKDRMLRYFLARKGQKVPLPDILSTFRNIAEPMRVIRYLRADGYDIESIVERNTGRIARSFYIYHGWNEIINDK